MIGEVVVGNDPDGIVTGTAYVPVDVCCTAHQHPSLGRLEPPDRLAQAAPQSKPRRPLPARTSPQP